MWAKSEISFFSMRKMGLGNDSSFVQDWGKMLHNIGGHAWRFERKLVIIIKEFVDVLYQTPQSNLCSYIYEPPTCTWTISGLLAPK